MPPAKSASKPTLSAMLTCRRGSVVFLALVASLAPCAHARTTEIETIRAALPALAAPVEIDLDSVEIPTIRAKTLADAVCAQGWIHARERFLQMDLARREPAGEVGQIVPQGVALDREAVNLGLRAIAERAVARLPERHRALLEAYAAGVNAQLAVAKPFEYQLLKAPCAPWTPADSMLVQLSMARYLDSSDDLDRARTPLHQALGAEIAAYFTSSRGVLDMTVDGSPSPAAIPIPDAAALDLRATAPQSADAPTEAPATKPLETPGSNAFAVAASRTRDGRAMVGNDMHLAHMAPNFWYRVDLQWDDGRLVGLSLPGVPAIVQGTNGHVAWGFTNLTADLSDLIVVERDPANPDAYLTNDGSKPLVRRSVAIGRGAAAAEVECFSTDFGPIVGAMPDGRLVALRSPILIDGAIDFGLFDMADARTLEAALACARLWKGPPQNVLVAANDGRIGWTISGALPLRTRATPRIVDWREAEPWRGSVPMEKKPTIIDPPSGILTSGNQLAINPSAELAAVLGADEAHGDRAFRLRELLESRSDWDEAALHQAQLDVRSPRLIRWRDAIIASLGSAALPELSEKARAELAGWDGEVTVTSSAPVLLDAFRREMALDFGGWLAATPSGKSRALTAEAARSALDDEALLRILETRPAHFVAGTGEDAWRAKVTGWLARAAEGSRAATTKEPAGVFATRGDRNRLSMRHPAADSLGAAARLAEMPKAPLPGHPTCVRVQTPRFGASQRSVVSPAKLDAAVLVTPGGQSGLPTSPHFRNLHAWWQDGKPYPLLPGDTKKRIALSNEVQAPAEAQPAAPKPVSPSS
jgi:penicillin G amidase